MKVLLNDCYGCFSFSEDFLNFLASRQVVLGSLNGETYRDDQQIVSLALEFGLDKASGKCASLFCEEIPDGCMYSISEYDGVETISHTWYVISSEKLASGLSEEELSIIKEVDFIRVKG